jgi:hypothetical protein
VRLDRAQTGAILLDLAETLALQAAPLGSDVELLLAAAVPGMAAADVRGKVVDVDTATTVDCAALHALGYLLQHARNRACVSRCVGPSPGLHALGYLLQHARNRACVSRCVGPSPGLHALGYLLQHARNRACLQVRGALPVLVGLYRPKSPNFLRLVPA